MLVHSARLAAIFLLAVWVGPVTFVQTDSWALLSWAGAPGRATATAAINDESGPQNVPAGEALVLDPGTPLKLHLRDGSKVEGRFLGRTLLDSTSYAKRYAKYAASATWVPLALGETLRVTMRDGREWTAPFAGYGEMTLFVAGPDSARMLRVPFEFVREIFRADGTPILPRVLARAFRAHELPSAEALVLGDRVPGGTTAEQWAAALRVPVDEIESVTVNLPGHPQPTSGWVALGVVASVVLIVAIIIHNQPPSQPSCEPYTGYGPFFLHAHLTTRPFDLARGCFVGDPVAAADPWPGGLPAFAVASPESTDAAASR